MCVHVYHSINTLLFPTGFLPLQGEAINQRAQRRCLRPSVLKALGSSEGSPWLMDRNIQLVGLKKCHWFFQYKGFMLNFALLGLERCVVYLLSLRKLTASVSGLLPQMHHLGNWEALCSDKPPSAAWPLTKFCAPRHSKGCFYKTWFKNQWKKQDQIELADANCKAYPGLARIPSDHPNWVSNSSVHGCLASWLCHQSLAFGRSLWHHLSTPRAMDIYGWPFATDIADGILWFHAYICMYIYIIYIYIYLMVMYIYSSYKSLALPLSLSLSLHLHILWSLRLSFAEINILHVWYICWSSHCRLRFTQFPHVSPHAT